MRKIIRRKLFSHLPLLDDGLEGGDGGGRLQAEKTEEESELHAAPGVERVVVCQI